MARITRITFPEPVEPLAFFILGGLNMSFVGAALCAANALGLSFPFSRSLKKWSAVKPEEQQKVYERLSECPSALRRLRELEKKPVKRKRRTKKR